MTVYRNIASRLFTGGAVFSNAFTPRQIAGCVCWLRGDLGVVASGGAVSEWSDQSYVGTNDFTQSTAGNKPTYQATSACNSLPGLRFDGGDKLIGPQSSAVMTVGTAYVWQVISLSAVTLNDATVYGNDAPFGDSGAYYGCAVRNNAGTYQYRSYLDDGSLKEPTLITMSLNTTYVTKWKHTGGNLSHRLNSGTEESTAAGNIGGLTFNAEVGCNQGIRFITGDIAEKIHFTSALTATDERRVHWYLSQRYGTA